MRCETLRHLLTAALPGLFVLVCALALALGPQQEMSLTERRPLAQRPEMTLASLGSGRFMEAFDDYAADQFPGREGFRTLKALVGRYLLGQRDNNGIYLSGGHAAKIDYPLDPDALAYAAGRMKDLYDRIAAGTDSRAYLAIVPDKGQYLSPGGPWPVLDHRALAEEMRRRSPWAEYVDLFPLLSQDAYYRTDPHWRQEALPGVAAALAGAMGARLPETAYEHTALDGPFYGAYRGQAALPMDPDTLTYLQSPLLSNARVYHYETDAWSDGPYDMDKAAGADPYEIFLSGPESLLRLEHPDPDTGRELLIVRDSFASPLAPLLLPGYAAVTLADIRYLPARRMAQLLGQGDRDVLFLFSAAVLNHSQTLK